MTSSTTENICSLKKCLINKVMEIKESGLDNVDTHELGEVIDMIKDLSETERNCAEADYYESVTDAMDEYGSGKHGYNPYPGKHNRIGKDPQSEDRYDRWAATIRTDYYDDPDYDESFGRPFNEYRSAKRHYTMSKSDSDKMKMEDRANAHISSVIATIKEIWREADTNQKVQIKEDMTKLVNEMM